MIGTIRQGNFDIDHLEAGNKAFFQGFTNTFFNGRNVLSRYGAAKNLIDEFKAVSYTHLPRTFKTDLRCRLRALYAQ